MSSGNFDFPITLDAFVSAAKAAFCNRAKMEKTVYLFLLFGAISTLCNGVEVNAKARKTLPEIDRKLKLLNRPAVKSIKV